MIRGGAGAVAERGYYSGFHYISSRCAVPFDPPLLR